MCLTYAFFFYRKFIGEDLLVKGYFVLTVLAYLHLSISVIDLLTTHLKIRCFVIARPKSQ